MSPLFAADANMGVLICYDVDARSVSGAGRRAERVPRASARPSLMLLFALTGAKALRMLSCYAKLIQESVSLKI